MSSALRERFYVVDSLGRCISSFGKADLAERMLCGISLSDERPSLAVAFSCHWITLIFLVAFCLFLCMFLAEPSFSEFRASGIGTRSFRFSWHFVFPIKKALQPDGGRARNEQTLGDYPQSFCTSTPQGNLKVVCLVNRHCNDITGLNSHSITFTLIYSHFAKYF